MTWWRHRKPCRIFFTIDASYQLAAFRRITNNVFYNTSQNIFKEILLILMIGIRNPIHICASKILCLHYDDVIVGAIASQITSHTIVYANVYSDADQRKHQSSASLAFLQGIHRGPVNSPHKGPVTRKMFPFDDVIMETKDTFCRLNVIYVGIILRRLRHDGCICPGTK